MGAQLIQLTSKSHHESILGSMQQFRLQGQLSDVTVQVDYQGDVQEFQAHQVMLAASSGYFKKILLSQEAARHKLLLPDMHFNDFSKFLEFVYTGKVEVARDKIGDIHAAAQFLDCGDLAEICGEALSAGIQQTPTVKTSAPEAAENEDSSGAKKEKGTKGRKQPRSLILKRRLSPQSTEKDVSKQANNSATSEKRLKLTLAGRKVLQRCLYIEGADLKNENQVGEVEELEGRTEAQNQAEIGAKQASDVHEWVCEEPEQSNDEDSQMVSQGDVGVEEGEEEEDVEGEEEDDDEEDEGEEAADSKETVKKSSRFQFECNKCLRTFHYEKSYMKHISMYHGVKAEVINRCEICLQTFTNRSNLKIHEKHVHSTERLFSCSTCTKTFKRKKDVIRHQKQVHERSNTQHICPDCGKSLSSKGALLLHTRTHTGVRPFECKECGARFTQNTALKMHGRTHTGEKPFPCDECDARFSQKHMLTYHKRSHTGEKPFMCEACGKSFASKEYLRHHSNIHTGSRPYKCEHCGRGFAQRNSLHQHLKVHTGERPYSCKDCDKQFTQLNALQRHQRIHTGEKPYMCGLCGRTFTDKSTLRRHTMIHDSDAPWKTYLVMLEGNVEDKKPKASPRGKADKTGAEEKRSTTRRSSAAAASSTSTGAGKSVSPAKVHAEPIVTEPVTIPSDWAAHGAIALVSHGALGGITVIHTEVPSGAQIQPIVTTDATGAGVISLDSGTTIQVPFSIPVSVAGAIPLTSEASSSAISLVASAPDSASASQIQTVATSSVLEAAASQTILAPAETETKEAAPASDVLQTDIQTVVIGDELLRKEKSPVKEAADEPKHDLATESV